MSLDVYLTTKEPVPRRGSGIFVRENGQIHEISREEWDERNPGREPCFANGTEQSNEAYSANITHNLGPMAAEAGIYNPLWRPEEVGITKAHQLIEPLESGVALLKSDPSRFERFNPKNGWGSYRDFVPWVEQYLAACKAHPDADVHVSR